MIWWKNKKIKEMKKFQKSNIELIINLEEFLLN
jgi:hypothetical protein